MTTYDKIATTYDRFYSKSEHEKEDRKVIDSLISWLLPPTTSMLDLGCGTGAALDIIRNVGFVIEDYVGVDSSKLMLSEFQKKDMNLPYSVLIEASFDDDDLIDRIRTGGPNRRSHYDLVTAFYCIQYSSDPISTLVGVGELMHDLSALVTITYSNSFVSTDDYIVRDHIDHQKYHSWEEIFESEKFNSTFEVTARVKYGVSDDGSHKFDLTHSRRR